MDKAPMINENEKLQCSLVSRLPYAELKDVIEEVCKHQIDADHEYYLSTFCQQIKSIPNPYEKYSCGTQAWKNCEHMRQTILSHFVHGGKK